MDLACCYWFEILVCLFSSVPGMAFWFFATGEAWAISTILFGGEVLAVLLIVIGRGCFFA